METLQMMTAQYETLKILSWIAEKATHPDRYLCNPREMILASKTEWDLMQEHLYDLETEGYVTIASTIPISFSITEKGIKKVNSLAGRSSGIRQFIML